MNRELRVLDLFSGIGGFSLGLERAGMRTVAFCEIDPYARAVLRKHWPDVPCYDDVRILTADRLAGDGIAVDVICGGFPCQDISHAGKGAGLAGERSGLWSEIARLVGELRPRYVIVENVAALLSRGLGDVLRDLAEVGYDAEWHCIPASYVGAPHRRDRIWIIAYPNGQRGSAEVEPRENVVNDLREPAQLRYREGQAESEVADADQSRLEGWLGRGVQERARQRLAGACGASMGDTADSRRKGAGYVESEAGQARQLGGAAWWRIEPDVGRVAHGVPARVDRLRCLGNAVVPQIPEIIGRAILAAEQEHENAAA